MEATKNTQTTSGDFYTACGHITNSRSLLDLAAEYILSGQDATAEEKLYNILFAVETARNEARTAEAELMDFNPYRLGTAWSKAIEAENAALKAHLVRLEEEKAEAWKREPGACKEEETAPPPRKIRGSRGANKRAVYSFMGSVERCFNSKRRPGKAPL